MNDTTLRAKLQTTGGGSANYPFDEALTPDEEISESGSQFPETRRVVTSRSIPSNPHDATARLSIKVRHQRRSKTVARSGARWENSKYIDVKTLKSDQEVKLRLSHRETKRLFLVLVRRYSAIGDLEALLAEAGYMLLRNERGVETESVFRDVVQQLLGAGDQRFVDALIDLCPNLLQIAQLKREHERKSAALEEFRTSLKEQTWSEGRWERFFRDNEWIFGFGLSYQYLNTAFDQPYYGGKRVSGKGGHYGDVLMGTVADARFTVLVELKKPDAELLGRTVYRGDDIWHVSKEVAGGVAQLQANCATWNRNERDVWRLEKEQGIHTHEPKGILVVGNLDSLEGDESKIACFERFRRCLHNPEIITFDELFRRAEFVVSSSGHLEESFPTQAEDVEVDFENIGW